MKFNIPVVIFAGGKSSRMGMDKALLPFGGYTSLVQYQYERLRILFEEVYISTKKDKFDFNANLIHDNYKVSSPLAGIVSVFETLEADRIFILSVDAPFVSKTVIKKLIEKDKEEFDAVVAKSQSGLQPLCAIYKRSLLPLAKNQLENNRQKLTTLLEKGKSLSVMFEKDILFTNLNYPEEYKDALLRINQI